MIHKNMIYQKKLKQIFNTRSAAALTAIAVLLSTCGFNLSVKAAPPSLIGGKAFRDFNANGVQDAGGAGLPDESLAGQPGVTVTFYDQSGAAAGSTVTAADGSFTMTVDSAKLYRVEFTNLPDGLLPGANAAGSTVRFVAGNDSAPVNLALTDPQEYSYDRSPQVAVTSFVNNDWQDTTPGYQFAIDRFNYSDAGQSPEPAIIGEKNQVGSVWGLAYSRTADLVYTSAFLKRHAAMYENPEGVPHPGQIFVTTNPKAAAPTANAAPFFDVGTMPGVNVGAVSSNAVRGVNVSFSSNNRDADSFAKVGAVGLGDLDISPDQQFLWTVSLADKKLIKIPVSNPSLAQAFDIPAPTGTAACAGGEHRPFGLAFHRGKLYIGEVCDASISKSVNDLKAVVVSVNPAATVPTAAAATEFQMSLNYQKGYVRPDVCFAASDYSANAGAPLSRANNFHPWENDFSQIPLDACSNGPAKFYPEPILSNLTFDDDGSLILSFADRFALQSSVFHLTPIDIYPNGGTKQAAGEIGVSDGDIIRACNVAGNYVLQGGAGCPMPHSVYDEPGGSSLQADDTIYSDTNGEGPNGGEWYSADHSLDSQDPFLHTETAEGSAVMLAGSGQVISTAMSPFVFNSAGVQFMNNQSGLLDKAYQIYRPNKASSSGGEALNNKSAALGDLELLTEPAPVSIGNRVWVDCNHDGVQDASERALPGVTVQLVIGGVVVATAVTDENGNYYFSNDPHGSSTGSTIYNLSQLQPGVPFTIRIPLNQPVLATSAMVVTAQNTLGGSVFNSAADARDSDGDNAGAIASPGNAGYTSVSGIAGALADPTGNITGSSPGANNHTYDFGFYSSSMSAAEVSLAGKTVNDKGRALAGVTLNLQTADGRRLTTRSNSFGYFRFAHLNAGTMVVLTPVLKAYRFAGAGSVYSLTDNLSDLQLVGQTTGLKKVQTSLQSGKSGK